MRAFLLTAIITATLMAPATLAETQLCAGENGTDVCAGDFDWTDDCSGSEPTWGWARTGVIAHANGMEVGVVGFELCDNEYGGANGVLIYTYDEQNGYTSAGIYCYEFYLDFPCYAAAGSWAVSTIFVGPPNPGWGHVLP